MKKVVSLLLTVLMTLCVLSVNVLAFDNKPAELTVKVKYVVHANPVLTLPSEKTIFKGEKFNPLDVVVSAKDDEGTDLKSNVGVSGQYDVNTVGSYTLKYSVTDSFGGSDEKTFKLNVIEKLKEENTSEQVTVKEDAPVKEVEADIKTDSIVDSVVREEGNKTSTLTPEQKQAIKDGASVKLELTVDSTADDSTNEDSKLIDKAIKEVNSSTAIGALLDINLLCTVTRNNESLGTSKITVTSEPVKVTVTVPDTLVNTDSTVTRDYDVARLHDGKVDLLGAKYDAASKKLTFDTSLFSTYAIVYTDTKVEQPKKNASSSSSSGYKKPVVNTGWGFSPANIEFTGTSGSTTLEVDGLPECNVLNVSYTQTLDLKSAEGKTVNARVDFVKEIKENNDYALTVNLQNPSDKPAPGTYEGTITVSFIIKEYEARIGDEYCVTLEDAIDAANDGDTIDILKDINGNIDSTSNIGFTINNKSVTLNGNNHTVTLNDGFNNNTYGIYIAGDAAKTVKINSLNINAIGVERAIRSEESVNVFIENCKITTNGVGIHVKGSNKVEINNCSITVDVIDNSKYSAHLRTGVMVGGENADVTVNNCIIDAVNKNKTDDKNTMCKGLYVGSLSKKAKITANNTKVVADYSIAIDGAQYDNTTFEEKPTQIIINSGEYSGLFGSPSGLSYKKLVINDGSFSGLNGFNDFNGKDNDIAKLVISGGTFNIKPDAKFITDGYEAIRVENIYQVVGDTAVVKTAAELQAILAAFTDAGSGDKVVVINEDIRLAQGETWNPAHVDGYNGAGVVTIEGNGHTIKDLNAPLLAGGFAGNSGIIINDLTLDNSTIDDTHADQGLGAFICSIDSMPTIKLNNCHLKNSTIKSTGGARVGGLIGWSAGYNNPNDGPVDTYITIDNCSVDNTSITAAGSVGAIIGHAGNNPATFHTITNCTVTDTTLNSTDDGGWRVGVVVGTANVGKVTISDITESGNNLTQTDKTAPEHSNLYGRFVPGDTGKLTIDGVAITE